MSEEQRGVGSDVESAVDVNRRALVRGAAWSMPVIAAATAAPAYAASLCPPGSATTVTVSGPEQTTVTASLPACATQVTFEVVGGDGGRINGLTIGRGSRITGTIALAPGSTHALTLIAGGAGSGGGVDPRLGGVGYGNGGNSYGATGAGGAGSALIIDGTPYVVAGGGGGGGNANVTVQNPGNATVTLLAPQYGVDAGLGSVDDPLSTGYGFAFTFGGDLVLAVGGGKGAMGATGGAAAPGAVFAGGAAGDQFAGAAGGNHGSGNNGGGNGGSGPTQQLSSGVSGGGGGGGWAGGGGGRAVRKTAGGAGGVADAGSAGGAGSSYVGGPGVGVSTRGKRGDARGHGWVTISWS